MTRGNLPPTMHRRSHLAPRRAAPLLAVLVGAAFLASCRPPEGKATRAADAPVVVVRLDGPARVGVVPLVVEVTAAGAPVTGAVVKVTGDMTHAGMQPVTAAAVETGDGGYRAAGFAFAMAGDWVVTADVTTPAGTRVSGALLTTVAPK